MAIATAVIIFMYATTFKTALQGTFLAAVLMLALGFLFASIMVGVKIEPFKMNRFVESVLWSIMGFVVIWLINKTVPFRLDVAIVDIRLFSVLMGVAEELFFRLWLTTFIHKTTKSVLIALTVSSAIWTFYHISRYGGALNLWFIIFMSGIFLGYIILQSKMADGVIFAHALVNYLATA